MKENKVRKNYKRKLLSGCLCSFTSSLSPLSHPFLLSKTSQLLVISLFDWSLMLFLFLFLTNIYSASFFAKFLSPFPYVHKYDHIFSYYQRSSWLKFDNILFSTCAVLYFPSFALIFLYVYDVSFSLTLNIIPLLTF